MKRISFSKQHLAAALLLLLLFSSGCGGEAKAPVKIHINTSTAIPPTSSLPAAYPLPEPKTSGPVSLEAALQSRCSTRDFTSQELDPSEISQLLWAAQGIADPRGFRTAPSAGALYPLELYIVTADGVFHYLPQKHALEVIRGGDLHAPLHDAALGQDPVLEAPLVMVIAALYERTQAKYGPERSPTVPKPTLPTFTMSKLLPAYVLGQSVTKLPNREMAIKLTMPTTKAAPKPTRKGLIPNTLNVRKLVFSPTPARAMTKKYPAHVLTNV